MRSLLITVLCLFTICPLSLASPQIPARMEQASESRRRPVQEALQPSIVTGARMQLVQRETGLGTDEISLLYSSSGARYFGQFACAMLVSQRLKLDHNAVLQGLFKMNLGQVLKQMGVEHSVASDHILTAARELGAAEKKAVR